jgi:hypothetical protein
MADAGSRLYAIDGSVMGIQTDRPSVAGDRPPR